MATMPYYLIAVHLSQEAQLLFDRSIVGSGLFLPGLVAHRQQRHLQHRTVARNVGEDKLGSITWGLQSILIITIQSARRDNRNILFYGRSGSQQEYRSERVVPDSPVHDGW